MPYELLERTYNTLSAEQQMIVYNLILSLSRLNNNSEATTPAKRTFGDFANIATATFSDDWSMTEEDLCSL